MPSPTSPLETARAIAARVAAGELRACDVVEDHIAHLDAVDARLHAIVWRRYDAARAEAEALDRRRAAGEPLGPLAGVPMTIKESIDLAGSPATYGVVGRDGLAAADDPHVARLRQAGAIVLGKTNVAQLLMYTESDNPRFGRTLHPLDAERSPGGSSGGEAAIIAAGGGPIGLGTDIGGSIRLPAAWCGLVGLKPTQGRTPDRGRGSIPIGQVAIESQVGPLARNVADLALAYRIITGSDEPAPIPMSGLRIGWFDDDGVFPACAAARRGVAEAVELLRSMGAELVPLQPPDLLLARELFFRLLGSDGFAGGKRVLGGSPRAPQIALVERAAGAPRWLRGLIGWLLRVTGRPEQSLILGWSSDRADDYFRAAERAIDYRARWLETMREARLDVVLSPATALPAVRHGARRELNLMGTYTLLYNLLGWPAGSVPVTRVRKDEETLTPRGDTHADRHARDAERGSNGLPIGVSIAATPGREDRVLAVMGAIERGVLPSATR